MPPTPRSRKARIAALRRQLQAQGQGMSEIAWRIAADEHVTPRAAWRLAHGLSQQDVADRYNTWFPPGSDAALITAKQVSYWENWPQSGREPSVTTLGRLARIYGCTISALITDHENPGATQATETADRTGASTVKPSIARPGAAEHNGLPMTREINAGDVISWVESTNTSQNVIEYLRSAAVKAAEEHASKPPGLVLPQVRQLHGMVQALLRGGKQRYRQTAELMQLDSEILAHLCQLLGDVHRDAPAFAYARASIALADEVGASAAAAFSAQAQIARWRGRYTEAADLAAEGLKRSLRGPLRTLLAHQEANARAIIGDSHRARRALDSSDMVEAGGRVYSAWSCPPARQALYRIGVALNMGEPQEAVRQAADAESMWQRERSKAFGTWAHFQISAARAHVLTGSLEGAIDHVMPVLTMPQEFRISTLASNIVTLDRLLVPKQFSKSSSVSSLREQIREFTTSSRAAATESEVESEVESE